MSVDEGLLQVDDVIDILCMLAKDSNLRITVKESLKGGLIAGLATVIGGLIGGKTGLAIGGAAGGLAAMTMTDSFESVATVLLKMDQENKEKLFAKAKEIFGKASITDVAKMNEAIKDPEMKSKLLRLIIDHVENQLQMNVVD